MRLYYFLILLIAIFIHGTLPAQVKPIAPSRYWVHFKYKGHTPYSLLNATPYLSPYSLNRKQLHQIPVDSLDLPVDPDYIDSVKHTGAVILNRSRWMNAVTVQLHDSAELRNILKLTFVSGLHHVGTASVQCRGVKEGALEELLPSDTLQYGVSYHQLHMINLPLLHAYGFKGSAVRIAVLDAGFTFVDKWAAFDSLFLQKRFLDHWDFVRHRGDSTFFWDGHGAMVLSTITANIPGQYVGASPNASVALYHTEDAATENVIEEDNWCSASERADSLGVDIISSSLGYTTFDSACLCNADYAHLNGHTTHISIAATIATRKGILVCNSAGNEGNNSWYHIGAPADADSILAVGAVNDTGEIAGFSSRGPTSDGRIKPDVDALGVHTWLIDPSNGGVTRNSGTSFSNPIIAGAAACLWSTCPQASNVQIREAIIQSANRYTNPDNKYGYGIPDMIKAANILYQITGCPIKDSRYNYFKDKLITISPNPAHNSVNMTFVSTDLSPITVNWYDISGRVMAQASFVPPLTGINTVQIADVSSWSSGIYIARIMLGKEVYSKLVVVKNNY